MKSNEANIELIAFCGLYCGECRSYKKGSCKGCKENTKATWCKIRKCNIEKNTSNCSECTDFNNLNECKLLNNFIGKVFGFIFKTDRVGSLEYIKKAGAIRYAEEMTANHTMSLKKQKRA